MSVLSIIFYAFLLYLLYRLVFNFIIPVYRTTRQVKRSFREMHERMNQQQHQGNGADTHTQEQTKGKDLNTDNVGEYIDFEEIK